jgi:hypothetical protein
MPSGFDSGSRRLHPAGVRDRRDQRFSGLERYTQSYQHVDSRVEYPYGSQAWWWESGTIT